MKNETMQRWMEIVEYKITDVEACEWNGFAGNKDLYYTDDNCQQSISYDSDKNTVSRLEVCDFVNSRAYYWISPEWKEENKVRYAEIVTAYKNCWQNMKVAEVELLDDFFDKAESIYFTKEYDTRIKVPIDLSDEEIFSLMKMAHERDITLNKLVEEILEKSIVDLKEKNV